MLENNRLYRRIQVNNLFRTFAKTYSRQTPKTQPQQHPPLLDRTNHTHPFDRSNLRSCLEQRSNATITANSHRSTYKGQTALTLNNKTPNSRTSNRNPFSQTITIDVEESQKNHNYSGSPLLNSLIAKRKESGSSLASIRENFKLKSCVLREGEQYEGKQEVGEFSILELQDQDLIKKRNSKCRFRGNLGGALLLRLKGAREVAKGRDTPSHLLSRYVGAIEFGSREGQEY